MSKEVVEQLCVPLKTNNAAQLRQRMSRHLERPSRAEPLDGSGILVGSYSAEEAEQWIQHYPKFS